MIMSQYPTTHLYETKGVYATFITSLMRISLRDMNYESCSLSPSPFRSYFPHIRWEGVRDEFSGRQSRIYVQWYVSAVRLSRWRSSNNARRTFECVVILGLCSSRTTEHPPPLTVLAPITQSFVQYSEERQLFTAFCGRPFHFPPRI